MTETNIGAVQHDLEAPSGYSAFLEQVKQRITSARTQAAMAVNRELLELYWTIGKEIAG